MRGGNHRHGGTGEHHDHAEAGEHHNGGPEAVIAPQRVEQAAQSGEPAEPLGVTLFDPPSLGQSGGGRIRPRASARASARARGTSIRPRRLAGSYGAGASPRIVTCHAASPIVRTPARTGCRGPRRRRTGPWRRRRVPSAPRHLCRRMRLRHRPRAPSPCPRARARSR